MERLLPLLEHALDAVVGIDQNEKIIYWNPQAEKIFGYSRAEAINQNMAEIIIPVRMREMHRAGMYHFLTTGDGPILNQRIEVPAIRRNGEEFLVELTVTPLKIADEQFFYSFIRDIGDAKILEKERSRLLRNAQDAVRARDEFIGICSHELKTPLTSLALQFQLVEQQIIKKDPKVFLPENVAKRAESARRQLKRLERLIDDMLDISRIEIDKLHLQFGVFDLNSLISEITERFNFAKNNVEIIWSSGDAVQIEGDKDRIEQVITNLITNGMKYGENKPIHLSLAVLENTVKISLRDEGKGIAQENLTRIFGKFERAVSSSEVSGLGIGLFISKTIVEGHQGTIKAESKLGKGSTFSVVLPIKHKV